MLKHKRAETASDEIPSAVKTLARIADKSVKLSVADTDGIAIGMSVLGEGVVPGTRVANVEAPTTVILSQGASVSARGLPVMDRELIFAAA